jgi:translation initiation factor IF-3
VIADNGDQLGIMTVHAALTAANEAALDLVEVAPEADPPVCRIMDFGRYKYQQSKKVSESRKKAGTIEVKEVKFRPKTGEHDYQFKLKNILKFLGEKNKIKVTLTFKGRELNYTKIGSDLMKRLIADTSELGQPEQEPKLEHRSLTMILTPKA